VAKYPVEAKLIEQLRGIANHISSDGKAIISGAPDEIEWAIGDYVDTEVDFSSI